MRDVLVLAGNDTRLIKVSAREYAGPCPGCGGNDRFRVRLKERNGEQVWMWMCRNCYDAASHGWGDAIEYCRKFRSMDFPEARDYVNEIEETRDRVDKVLGTVKRMSAESWQRRAVEWSDEAIARLESDEGKEALAYLHSRGLRPDTIKKARLGFARYKHPKTKRVVPCIVIPWYASGQIVKVQLRDYRPDAPHDERYFMLPGSSNDGLYLVDSLALKREATLVVEGEFDALVAAQECGDIASVVATGSTTGGQNFRNVVRLATQELVLLAFDAEQKGDQAAQWWIDRLDNAMRCRPLVHDVNEMLLKGYDVHTWIQGLLEVLNGTDEGDEEEIAEDDSSVASASVEVPAEDIDVSVDDDELSYCVVCRAEVEVFDANGKPYCSKHRPLSIEQVRDKFVEAFPGWRVEIEPVGTRTYTGIPDSEQRSDYWAGVETRSLRPPKDRHGVPYYTEEKWKKKLEELRHPSYEHLDKLYSHYPGGYAGYCRMHRRGSSPDGSDQGA